MGDNPDNDSSPPILTPPPPKRSKYSKSHSPAFITPRTANSTRTRSRSRSRSPSPHPSSAPFIPLSINRAILSITEGMVDASVFNVEQIEYLETYEKHIYIKLDFTRCSDSFIQATIHHGASSDVSIPTKYRKSAKMVKEYLRLSREAQRVLLNNDNNYVHAFDDDKIEKRCIYLVRSVLMVGSNVVWGDEEEEGYNSLVRSSIHQKKNLLKENKHEVCGVLVSGQTEYVLKELYSGRVQKRGSHQYYRYAFASRNCSAPSNGELLCTHCDNIKKGLRRLCRLRYEYDNRTLHKNTKTSILMKASPSKTQKKIEMVVDNLRSVQKCNHYLNSRLEDQRKKDGVSIGIDKCSELFDESAEVEAKQILDSREEISANKDLLSRLLWNQSVQATIDAKMKGSKQVRYHPIMLRFAMMIKGKLNSGMYQFVSKVFNLPSIRTIRHYDSVDGSSPDGIQFNVVRLMRSRLKDGIRIGKENGKSDSSIQWMRMGSLPFDSMSIKNKVKFDPHTHELVGFEEGALKENVLLKELEALDQQSAGGTVQKKSLRPDLSQQFLIFVYTSWDADTAEMKSVVARYATGSGITAEFLVPKIRDIISALYVHGFIVVNICGDGATENRSSFKQLATLIARDIFGSRCDNCTKTSQQSTKLSLLDNLPNDKLPIAFLHPCDSTIKVFIGGEMPHLVKKIVNRLERTSSVKNKVDLKFRGEELSLEMIKDAWMWDDDGFGAIRKTFLTEDHFFLNAYSRMRVHLAVQVLSSSVVSLIDGYSLEKGANIQRKYEPLKTIVKACDRLVDIWSANYAKKCECINSSCHPHLKELHTILLLFAEWKNDSKTKDEFITGESWEDLCWLVYAMEGIATEYLLKDKSRRMMQRRGGSDVCENEFAAFRQSNSNGTEYDIRGIEARRSAYRGHNVSSFSKLVKSNSGRGDRVDLQILSERLKRKK